MRLRTRLATSAAVVGTLVLSLVPGAPAGAATPAIDDALAWLATQQEADGGFEVANFPGFETSDAIYAIAAAGQGSDTWSTTSALAAVEAWDTEGGKTPLDAVDDWVDAVQAGGDVAVKAQQAAKVIVLVTLPLGLEETDFDPSGDTEAPVNLRAALQAGAGTGDYAGLTFGGKAYAAWALGGLHRLWGDAVTVPTALTDALLAGQQANGSFDFSGDPGGTGYDNDLTATVIMALRSADVDQGIPKAVVSLGLQQRWNGEWAGVTDDGSPNTTGLVMQAAGALGSRDGDACWRDRADARLAGVPYPSPTEALEDRQTPAGYFAGPYDGFGLNTTGTSQAVQGLAAAEGQSRYQPDVPCATTPVVGNRRTVNALYVDLLVRLADPAGATYWTQQFDGGMSPALLAKRFTGTPEYAGRVVERLYQEHLGRASTANERLLGGNYVTAGYRNLVAAGILGGDEYYGNTAPQFPSGPATAETWARALYPSTVGRPASEADVDYVEAQIGAGTSRQDIAYALLRTSEGRNVLVRDIYRQLLRRSPVGPDLTYWGGELRRGVSPERLVTLIAGSREYRDSTQAV